MISRLDGLFMEHQALIQNWTGSRQAAGAIENFLRQQMRMPGAEGEKEFVVRERFAQPLACLRDLIPLPLADGLYLTLQDLEVFLHRAHERMSSGFNPILRHQSA